MKILKARYNILRPVERLFELEKPIISITGGIATGKSTVTKMLEKKGLKVIDADAMVKYIYSQDDAKSFISKNFPSAWKEDGIDFRALRELFFQDEKIKNSVESFIYPRLPKAFLKEAAMIKDQDFFLYDVPLLYEKNLQSKMDLSVVVYAPADIQLARLMNRDSHEEELGRRIMSHQIDIEEKKDKADFVINNSTTLPELEAEVAQFLNQILN